MQIKKWIATGLAALMAGATLAGSALAATNLSQYPGFLATPSSAGSSLNALIVVGDNAAAADIVGAINVAASLAQTSYTSQAAAGTAGTVSYTNGVSLNTANSNLRLGNNVNLYKSTVTATDLPTLLAGGTVTDTSGNTYPYSQYLVVSGVASAYGIPGSLTSPVLYLNYATTTYPVTAQLIFSNPLPVGSTTFGQSISLFGNAYAIGSQSTNTTLVLFGGSNDITIAAGASQTVTVGGTSYAISVPGVNGQSTPYTATVTVTPAGGTAQTQSVQQGTSYTIGGLNVYVKTLTAYTAPTAGGSVELLAGANQINLVNNTAVTLGSLSSPTSTIVGSSVTVIPVTGQSKISQVNIQLPVPSTAQYVAAGSTWTDPVFGTISLAFTGLTPSTGDTLSFTTPSSTSAAVAFTDQRGQSGTVTFAYNTSGGLSLADGTGNAIHVLENESAKVNEYIVINAGNFSRMLKLTSITNATSSAAGQVTATGQFSGNTYTFSTGTVGSNVGTVYIDGQAYTMTINGTSGNQVAFDWSGSTTKYTVFPFLQTKFGNYVAFAKSQVLPVFSGTLVLPTGSISFAENTSGTFFGSVNNNNTVLTQTIGNVNYSVVAGAANTAPSIYLNASLTPAVLIWEEPVGTDPAKQNAITVSTSATGSPMYVTYNTPSLTSSFGSGTASGTTTTTYYDSFGSFVTFNQPSGAASSLTVTVPSVQSVVNVGVGGTSISASSTGTTGGTFNVVSPVTSAVGFLASEVTPAMETSNDVVLVGGPCANSLVQSLVTAGKLGSQYTCASGTPGSAWTPGTAYLVVVDNAFASGQQALVVAGTNAIDTRLAASVLQNYNSANVAGKLTGTAVKISGTSYSTASITATS